MRRRAPGLPRPSRFAFAAGLLLLLAAPDARAQLLPQNPRIFGYFQTGFLAQEHSSIGQAQKSFSMQQLNLFLRQDIDERWRAFVNVEMLNSYSSWRRWGALNLEEAWVRYRYDKRFSVRVGLQIPPFNRMNEIKNRTPLLPYIIRPLIYEISFSEIFPIEDFIPQRAFLSAYGQLGLRDPKFDYAFYVGNSPDVSSAEVDSLGQQIHTQSGVDTTNYWLFGGRVGIRAMEDNLELGVSATHTRTDALERLAPMIGLPPSVFHDRAQIRYGADGFYQWGPYSLTAEGVWLIWDDGRPEADGNSQFYFATFGWEVTDRLLLYGTEWLFYTKAFPKEPINWLMPGGGLTWGMGDAVVWKMQLSWIEAKQPPPYGSTDFLIGALAVSVSF